ncbi:MAG TPA: hypothetical protein VFY14_11280 [Streptomyces sp.]|nr:hypothetical protein [Streptomyces sp.]
MHWDNEYARAQVARAEELLSGLEKLPDSAAAARAVETVETLVGLYGDCLARIMDRLGRDGEDGDGGDGGDRGDPVRRLADDELVGHLLLVHDLHPDPVETRVRRALEGVRSRLPDGDDGAGPPAPSAPPSAESGEPLELLELSGTAVRVRLRVGGSGCPSSSESLERAVREAVTGAAPEIERVDVETVRGAAPTALIPVDSLFRDPALTVEKGG